MATGSMRKSVNIRSPRKAKKLVAALERSELSPSKKTEMSKEVRTLSKEQIVEIFGKNG